MYAGKHQSNSHGDKSSQAVTQNENNVECSHINYAVDLLSVKRSLARTGFLTNCRECRDQPVIDAGTDFTKFQLSLWLCLKCGNQACGKYRNKHALVHFKEYSSHAVCVSTTNWSVWCYDCKAYVDSTSQRKLQEVEEFLNEQASFEKINKQFTTFVSIQQIPRPVEQGADMIVENKGERDDFKIFGEYVASELRALQCDDNIKKLKRIIQKAILDISTIDATMKDFNRHKHPTATNSSK